MSTFPSNKVEALTMLYLENQGLVNKTPEELADLYEKTYKAISSRFGTGKVRVVNKSDIGL